MKKVISLILSLIMMLLFPLSAFGAEKVRIRNEVAFELSSTASALESMTPGEDYIDGEGVVYAASGKEAERIASQYGGSVKSYNEKTAVISFDEDTVSTFNRVSSLKTADTFVDPNYTVKLFEDPVPPNDMYASESSSPDAFQYFHEKIHTLDVSPKYRGKGVKIAVIDSGCVPGHEDSPFDDDHCQYLERFSDGVDKTIGHGVHCSGVIHSKRDNLVGGYGVAPEAEVYSIKITDSRTFGIDALIEGIRLAIKDEVDVISLSLGSTSSPAALKEAVEDAYNEGITIVAASGNEGNDKEQYPAAYEHVISIASSDKSDALSSFSDYGDWVDALVPGSDIVSTFIYGSDKTIAGTCNEDSYGIMNGTSMATPAAAGIAALVYCTDSDLTEIRDHTVPDAVREILLTNTDDRVYYYEDRSVKGMLRADKAVNAALNYSFAKEYNLMDRSGVFGPSLTGFIARGKSVSLKICDINGETKNKKESKRLIKKAVWETSDPGIITVKAGKVKCKKSASPGDTAVITAKLDDLTLSYKFTVTEPIVGAGYTEVIQGKKKVKLKIKKTINLETDAGSEISLKDPSLILGDDPGIRLVFSKDKDRIEKGTAYAAADDSYRYLVSFEKKKLKNNSIGIKRAKNGKAISAVLKNKGKYKITFLPTDGSGRSFTFKIKAV